MANLVLYMYVFFYSLFVCISAYANVCFKTTIIKPNIKIILTAGVPSSQALPGFLITPVAGLNLLRYKVSDSPNSFSEFFFLSFFLGFRRPNLITGLSGWRTPD